MRTILLSIICMMALGTCQAQDQKAERMKYIRKCYAEAKKKIDANGKNGKSPKDDQAIFEMLIGHEK